MRRFFLFFLLPVLFSCVKEKEVHTYKAENIVVTGEKRLEEDLSKIKIKAEEALAFCTSRNLSTDFCILIDMSLHSGIKRFFVWDFKNKTISGKYLVGHGCGINAWSKDDSRDRPEFSNEDGSHLSSLGKYRLEGRGYSEWGVNIKYLMHGLEDTNTNALKRFIVFHSWNLMSDEEVFPKGSPEGWGCPTISNNAMRKIDPMIQNTKKPVLMWIYN
ncbi:murein L,D-transpeptidase catalytic domain-containing protein [Chryseobacterium rhizosphaerae]|uniref:murein L,D-transpeptidase catalytic domain-containing protein n=1 Tax=Chryseobacterium rhizosphaerae TaxID=395937 RepID=UPI003D09612B